MLQYYQRHKSSAFHSTGLNSLLVDCWTTSHVGGAAGFGCCSRSIFSLQIHISYRFLRANVYVFQKCLCFFCAMVEMLMHEDDCCHECVLCFECFLLPYRDACSWNLTGCIQLALVRSLHLLLWHSSSRSCCRCSLFSPFISHLCRFVTSMCNLVRANHLLTLFFNF